MERRELIFMDAKSSKFWNIELDGARHTVTYGRLGTSGQSKTKEFPAPEKALADFNKLVASKLAKGYVEAAGQTPAAEGDSELLPAAAFVSVNKQDDLHENVRTFVGKKVADYDRDKGPARGGKATYRFRSDWDSDDLLPNLEHFLASDGAAEATGIVIGNWGGEDSSRSPDFIVDLLVKQKDRLPNLVALYFGDIVSEENEISWIQQTDMSPLLKAFPKLQVLRIRGGNSLQLKQPKHDKLRALAIETGGLAAEVVRSICTSKFPNLEHLELWLGTQEYGGTSTVQDLQPILSGKLFPKLKYLGLRNCEYADDIAAVVVNSPIVHRIETLDLSLGVLTDDGARALLSLPEDGELKKVSIHYNYATKGVLKQLKARKLTIDTSKPSDMEDDDEWRFVAVGE
ncbi:MAG: STM4015 family protein [Pirellulaceae bacterium]